MKQKAIPVAIILLACAWIYMGVVKYGLWFDGGPGGGFMPVFSGTLAILFAVFLLFKPETERIRIPVNVFIPPVAVVATILAAMVIGLLPALAVMLFLWLWKLERYPAPKSLVITAAPMLVIYGIFRLWLQVPFPTGVFDY